MSFLESYQEEQRKIDAEAPKPDASRLIHLAAANWMLGVVAAAIMTVLGLLPRHSDGSMKAIFLVPAFLVLGVAAAVLLKKRLVGQLAFRIVCWVILIVSCIVIPLGIWNDLDQIAR